MKHLKIPLIIIFLCCFLSIKSIEIVPVYQQEVPATTANSANSPISDNDQNSEITNQNLVSLQVEAPLNQNAVNQAIKEFNLQSTATPEALGSTYVLPLTRCDQNYAVEMKKTLEQLPANSGNDFKTLAQEYSIMIKQHYDLDMKIKRLENTVLNTALIAILRIPLSDYAACMTDTSPISQETTISL